jgi:hypothetical protein
VDLAGQGAAADAGGDLQFPERGAEVRDGTVRKRCDHKTSSDIVRYVLVADSVQPA